jgi:hypothetical protein
MADEPQTHTRYRPVVEEEAPAAPPERVDSRPAREAGLAAARDRFGGLDVPASLVGMLTALGLVALIAGVVAAAVGATGYQTGLDSEDVRDIAFESLIGGLVILFVSYLIGGWAAGRMARYNGATNGLMTGIWTLILAAILSGLAAALGDEYDVMRNIDMPQWFSTDALTAEAIVTGAIAVAVMLLGGLIGGAWGGRYHRLADETIVGARDDVYTRRDVETPV